MFEKYFAVTLDTFRSPLTPLEKGGTGVKVPLFKGSQCGLLPKGEASAFAERLVEKGVSPMSNWRGFRGI
ncbi:hypothetical protein A6V25_10575 [Nostoc sp. ATCC 53789]|nr:hypothetical protein GJB62_29475 [Nostoc sp. ATCC 53789]QLE52057.1 hypothetical protein FD724_31090 [Nostoc sp. C057]RCJ34416.1 hypothetical protein A6V25_10575 [Nostoc sp. ATCC 53789]